MKEETARLRDSIRRLVDEATEYPERIYLGRAIVDMNQTYRASLGLHEVAESLSNGEWKLVAHLVRSEMQMWLAMLGDGAHTAGIYELLFDSVYNDYLSPLRNAGVTDDKIGEDLDILRKATALCRDYLVTVAQSLANSLRSGFDEGIWERLQMIMSTDSSECAAAAGIRPDEIGWSTEEMDDFRRQYHLQINPVLEQFGRGNLSLPL